MPEIEFHERIDKSVAVGVHVGGRVVVASPEEWLETARDIVAKIEAHLTQRPPDEGYCAHDWSFPPEFCPVCNKRVPLIRLHG